MLKAEKKTKVQRDLKTELGIMVDCVKQGFGSTNDGNTARKFFEEIEIVSKVTGIDKRLIERFAVILQVCIIVLLKYGFYSIFLN